MEGTPPAAICGEVNSPESSGQYKWGSTFPVPCTLPVMPDPNMQGSGLAGHPVTPVVTAAG